MYACIADPTSPDRRKEGMLVGSLMDATLLSKFVI